MDELLNIITSANSATERQIKRRSLLKFGGISAAVAAFGLVPRQAWAQTRTGAVSLGTGDTAVLNFAYVLEQMESTYYTKVTNTFYSGGSSREREIFNDIREHETAHRAFLKNALGASAIPQLEFDFSSVNFHNRQSVLTTSRLFEDTGVAAYNGAGQLLRDPGHLLAAGRIVSVEARQAAILRDLIQPHSAAFAGDDVVDAFGLGAVAPPSEIMRRVAPFIRTPIDPATLPQKK